MRGNTVKDRDPVMRKTRKTFQGVSEFAYSKLIRDRRLLAKNLKAAGVITSYEDLATKVGVTIAQMREAIHGGSLTLPVEALEKLHELCDLLDPVLDWKVFENPLERIPLVGKSVTGICDLNGSEVSTVHQAGEFKVSVVPQLRCAIFHVEQEAVAILYPFEDLRLNAEVEVRVTTESSAFITRLGAQTLVVELQHRGQRSDGLLLFPKDPNRIYEELEWRDL
jgi:hypothetical protein